MISDSVLKYNKAINHYEALQVAAKICNYQANDN